MSTYRRNTNDYPSVVYLVWANHLHTHGIGEIVFTIDASLRAHYSLKPTESIKAGKINIIIDEFSNPYFVRRLAEIKREYPLTKYVFVATEFVTPISLFGIEFSRTFNFFKSKRDWANLFRNRNFILKMTHRLPSYMHQRYIGFMNALPLCDLLAFVHPKIGCELTKLADACPNLISPPTVLYPKLLVDFATQEEQLRKSRIGFDMTGTLTKYRRRIMKKLEKQFIRCGYHPVWRHVKFEESGSIVFGESTISFNYNRSAESENKENDGRYLFNINPPQRAGWQFSSPMRIARAALLGQIPVVTTKFNDHEIEDIALFWDGTLEKAQEILYLRMDRMPLLEAYCQSVQRYNAEAKEKNRHFIEALDMLLRKSG